MDTIFGFKVYGLPKNRIIGMGGALIALVLETVINGFGKPANDISAMVMEDMVILQ
jgi:hypothetical protein